jgi:hypothetical protein
VWKSTPDRFGYDANVGTGRKSLPYDASAATTSMIEALRHQFAKQAKIGAYDRNAAQPSTISHQPAWPYDASAAIWLQITTAAGLNGRNPYDANFGKSTMSKKFVTFAPRTGVRSGFRNIPASNWR